MFYGESRYAFYRIYGLKKSVRINATIGLKCLSYCLILCGDLKHSLSFLSFSLPNLTTLRHVITMILTNESEKHLVAEGLLQKTAAWQIVVEEVRLGSELSALVSPARTVPFSKMRLALSFQR